MPRTMGGGGRPDLQLFAGQANFVGPTTRYTFVPNPGFNLGIPDRLIPCFLIRS